MDTRWRGAMLLGWCWSGTLRATRHRHIPLHVTRVWRNACWAWSASIRPSSFRSCRDKRMSENCYSSTALNGNGMYLVYPEYRRRQLYISRHVTYDAIRTKTFQGVPNTLEGDWHPERRIQVRGSMVPRNTPRRQVPGRSSLWLSQTTKRPKNNNNSSNKQQQQQQQ